MPVSHEDLTAKARIRDAALVLIASHGLKGTSIRQIAEEAGVSPGLVQHHFGTKRDIGEAVSRWVVDQLLDASESVPPSDDPAEAHRQRIVAFDALLNESPVLATYLRRTVVEANPAERTWFKDVVIETMDRLRHRERVGLSRPSQDLEFEAAMIALLGFAPILLKPLLEHALDVSFDDDETRARWRAATTTLLTSPVYPDSAS